MSSLTLPKSSPDVELDCVAVEATPTLTRSTLDGFRRAAKLPHALFMSAFLGATAAQAAPHDNNGLDTVTRSFAAAATHPHNNLDPVAAALAKLDEPAKKQLAEFVTAYGYTPSTIQSLKHIQRFLPLLLQPSVIKYFEALKSNYDYEYEPGFLTLINTILPFDEIMARKTLYDIDGRKRLSGNELQKYNHDWNVAFSKKASEKMSVAEAVIESPETRRRVSEFKRKFAVPFTVCGAHALAALDEKQFAAVMEMPITAEQIANQVGPIFNGNEMMFTVAAATLPDAFQMYGALVRSLKYARPFEPFTLEDVASIKDVANIQELAPFWNWVEQEFVQGTISFLQLNRINRARGKIDSTALTHEGAESMREVALYFGKKLDAKEFFKNGDDYYWSVSERSAFERLQREYALKTTSESVSVGDVHESISRLIEDPAQFESLFTPENKTLIVAGTDVTNYSYETNPLVYFGQVNTSVSQIDGLIKGSAQVLQRLSRSKVNFAALVDVSASSLRAEKEGYYHFQKVDTPTAAVIKRFLEDPKALDDWELFAAAMPLDTVKISDLDQWVDLSAEQRGQLLKPEYARLFTTLHTSYNFACDLTNIVALTLKLEEGEMHDFFNDLLTPQCQKFYAQYKDLFVNKKDVVSAELDLLRLVNIHQLWKNSLKDKRCLHRAKKWTDLGGDVAQVIGESGESKKYIEVIDHPHFDRLVAAFKKNKIDIKYLFEIRTYIRDVETLESEDFIAFDAMLIAQYGFSDGILMLREAVDAYKDPEMHAFFADPSTQQFYKQLQEFGYSLSHNSADTVKEKYHELKMLLHAPQLFDYIDKLEKAYGVDVRRLAQLGKSAGAEQLFGELQSALTGVKQRGFDFITEFKKIVDSGEVQVLLAPETVEFVQYCTRNLGYRFTLLNLNSLIATAKHPRLVALARDPRMLEALGTLSSYLRKADPNNRALFNFDLIEIYEPIVLHKERFIECMTLLEQRFQYTICSLNEVVFISDLMMNDEMMEVLRSGDVDDLLHHNGLVFPITDLYGFLYLRNNPHGDIFDPELSQLAEETFGTRLGNDLKARIIFEKAAHDPEKNAALRSPEFRATRERLSRELGLVPSITDVEGVLQLMKHPEVFDFMEKAQFTSTSGIYDRRITTFFDVIPSILQMIRCDAIRYVDALNKATLGSWNYDIRPSDGPAWEALTQKYPHVSDFVKDAVALQKRSGMRSLTANDMYVGLILGERFSTDRVNLEARARAPFVQDIHRTDSNFESYTSYNDVSRLDIVQLNKVRALQDWLESPSARQTLGALIHTDVEKYPYTELGGVVVLNPDGTVEMHEHKAIANFSNGAYAVPPSAHMDSSVSLAQAHLHATSLVCDTYAGPSGSRFGAGADIGSVKGSGVDSVVFTSLKDHELAAHFFTPSGDVVFLGRFTY